MHETSMNFLQRVVYDFSPEGHTVVEFGSAIVNGEVGAFRQLSGRYIGVDLREAMGVDVVCDAADYRPEEGVKVDMVVCSSLLEHTPRGEEIIQNAFNILEQHGLLVLTTVGNPCPEHGGAGGDLPEGEYYKNLDPIEVLRWILNAGFSKVLAFETDVLLTGDIFVLAQKIMKNKFTKY